MDRDKKWLVDFSAAKTLLICWGLTVSSKLNWGSYIISIAKTASKKIGALTCSMKGCSISL